METIDNTTLVTATGGNHHGWGSPPFVPYGYAPAAPRWAYAGGYAGAYMGYAPAPMPARWAPMPAAWWPAYR